MDEQLPSCLLTLVIVALIVAGLALLYGVLRLAGVIG
jgi:hypothetical protein